MEGHETTYIDLVSERLGVEADLFDYIQANTFEVHNLDMVVPVQCTWAQLQ